MEHLCKMRKTSFYMALRNRLAVVNPERTIMCAERYGRGSWWRRRRRLSASCRRTCLCCAGWAWARTSTWPPTVAAECEILYQTCGSQAFGGLDRGRALSQMDEELMAMLQPFYTPKLNYTATPPAAMLTQVFWDEPCLRRRDATRSHRPFRKGDGVQLPGAGGVRGR